MRKQFAAVAVFICLALLLGIRGMPVSPAADVASAGFDPAAVNQVMDHSLAVIVYFDAPVETIGQIVKRLNARGIQSERVVPAWPLAVPAQDPAKEVVAVLGSATLLRDRYAVSVAHLFQVTDDKGAPLKMLQAWVIHRRVDHAIPVSVVAQTSLAGAHEFWNDYSVIRLEENPYLPPLRLANEGATRGQAVMFVGNVAGATFLARFNYATEFTSFFRRDDKGVLHISHWTEFALLCVHPGGGGDSGGGIFNTVGELVGIMYCGVELASEQYVFSNPLSYLKDFLKSNNLEELVSK